MSVKLSPPSQVPCYDVTQAARLITHLIPSACLSISSQFSETFGLNMFSTDMKSSRDSYRNIVIENKFNPLVSGSLVFHVDFYKQQHSI